MSSFVGSRQSSRKPRQSQANAPTEVVEVIDDDKQEVNVIDDDDDDDDEEEEEEFEVQAIVAHRVERGKFIYQVAWKGYGPNHNTWEPQENVEHAEEIVKAYWATQPANAMGVVKKRRSSTKARTPPRKVRDITPPKSDEDGVPDLDLTHTDALVKYEDVANWEELVETVDTVERSPGGELLVYLTMKDGDRIALATTVANSRCPQQMLAFYESHLEWRIS